MTRHTPPLLCLAAALVASLTGCHRGGPVQTATQSQTPQQVQADPNVPDQVKRIVQHNRAEMSGPPQRHDVPPGQ